MALKLMPERLFKYLVAGDTGYQRHVNGIYEYSWTGCDFVLTMTEGSTARGHRRDFTFTARSGEWSMLVRVIDVRTGWRKSKWRDGYSRQTITEKFTGSVERFREDATLALIAI